ncbi:fasciculation and elongation protein zeta-2-like isoform X2 [Artemia franciscana]
MWWTLTGNYGSLLPIDWSGSPTKRIVNNAEKKMESSLSSHSDYEDEAITSDFDVNTNLSQCSPQEPLVTADDVIKEIDDIMADSSYDSIYDVDNCAEDVGTGMELPPVPIVPGKWKREDLENLQLFHIKEVVQVLEKTIQDFSEVLIAELAYRDELEFSKELKNTFISLLLSVQNKRRQVNLEKNKPVPKSKTGKNEFNTKFVTTVIPYQPASGAPDNKSLQILINILQAMNEDSPNVPNLLTDYILRVLCPSTPT